MRGFSLPPPPHFVLYMQRLSMRPKVSGDSFLPFDCTMNEHIGSGVGAKNATDIQNVRFRRNDGNVMSHQNADAHLDERVLLSLLPKLLLLSLL